MNSSLPVTMYGQRTTKPNALRCCPRQVPLLIQPDFHNFDKHFLTVLSAFHVYRMSDVSIISKRSFHYMENFITQ